MTLVVYWLDHESNTLSQFKEFTDGPTQITDALEFCAELRKIKTISHITTCSEHPDCVSENGVSGIVDGKLPDGTPYQWRKRRSY